MQWGVSNIAIATNETISFSFVNCRHNWSQIAVWCRWFCLSISVDQSRRSTAQVCWQKKLCDLRLSSQNKNRPYPLGLLGTDITSVKKEVSVKCCYNVLSCYPSSTSGTLMARQRSTISFHLASLQATVIVGQAIERSYWRLFSRLRCPCLRLSDMDQNYSFVYIFCVHKHFFKYSIYNCNLYLMYKNWKVFLLCYFHKIFEILN